MHLPPVRFCAVSIAVRAPSLVGYLISAFPPNQPASRGVTPRDRPSSALSTVAPSHLYYPTPLRATCKLILFSPFPLRCVFRASLVNVHSFLNNSSKCHPVVLSDGCLENVIGLLSPLNFTDKDARAIRMMRYIRRENVPVFKLKVRFQIPSSKVSTCSLGLYYTDPRSNFLFP